MIFEGKIELYYFECSYKHLPLVGQFSLDFLIYKKYLLLAKFLNQDLKWSIFFTETIRKLQSFI